MRTFKVTITETYIATVALDDDVDDEDVWETIMDQYNADAIADKELDTGQVTDIEELE